MTRWPNLPAETKGSKYSNEKTVIDGITFDSKKEAHRYWELRLLQQAGQIMALQLQPTFVLQDAFTKNGVTFRPITYKADFQYICRITGKTVVEDTKGMKTEVFRIKNKLFEYKYPDLTLRIL